MTDPVAIRKYNPMVRGEEGYVLSTLLRDLRDADPSGLPDDHWFPAHRAYFQDLLRDPATVALIACAADEPGEILGYVIGANGALEWVHVRGRSPNLRGRGVARRLLTEAGLLSAPARFSTRLGRQRLRNPVRSRGLRRSRPSTASPSGSSTLTSSAPRT